MITCPHCGSTDVIATGSEQARKNGKHYADMICNNCSKSFWSKESEAIAMSRTVDRERSEADAARRDEEDKRITK